MAEEFTNPEISLEALPQYETVYYNKVSKRLRTKSLVQLSLVFGVVGMAYGFFLFFNAFGVVSVIAGGVFLLFFAMRYIDIILRQKHYGYALRAKDMVYRRGYITNKTTVIPYNRVQHSAISRTFFDKLFGIASLKIYTAGGSGSDISIPGLYPDLAKSLNNTLSQKVAAHEY